MPYTSFNALAEAFLASPDPAAFTRRLRLKVNHCEALITRLWSLIDAPHVPAR